MAEIQFTAYFSWITLYLLDLLTRISNVLLIVSIFSSSTLKNNTYLLTLWFYLPWSRCFRSTTGIPLHTTQCHIVMSWQYPCNTAIPWHSRSQSVSNHDASILIWTAATRVETLFPDTFLSSSFARQFGTIPDYNLSNATLEIWRIKWLANNMS